MKISCILLSLILIGPVSAADNAPARATIICPVGASPKVCLAAREVRRYIYLRTGQLLHIQAQSSGAGDSIAFKNDAQLGPEAYELRSDGHTLVISSGSDQGLLYGSYALAEKLGVRFYLHGDVVPDAQIPFALPVLQESHAPLFDTRGILPFHNFPEGPDWWNLDDYKTYVSQLAKMKMNFIGLHSYPEPVAEPLVWIGLPQDVNPDGTVKSSYHAKWANTLSAGSWSYASVKTSDFTGGASQLFTRDDYAADVMSEMCVSVQTQAQSNELFNRVGKQMGDVFSHARHLGVKTCVGTHTPLPIPAAVSARLKELGKNPSDPTVKKELYAGIFKRLKIAMPADYYWLWTPEHWTWSGNSPEEFKATIEDILVANDALTELGNPMQLVSSGWVLGPMENRSALDKKLPKGCPISCINRLVGHEGVESAFANIQNRPKWAMPWLENDPNMVGYQPWAARMRYDAVDAKRFGCTGLIGIHWRTKILAQNLSAMAQAAWDQSYIPAGFDAKPIKPGEMGPGGARAAYDNAIAGTDVPQVYQSVRYNFKGYQLPLPNGNYTVTLKFAELAYDKPGARVFGVKVQGKILAEKLDICALAGKNKAFDIKTEVKVSDGALSIDFQSLVDFPCINGIVIEGITDAANQLPSASYTRKINCGGGEACGYEADQSTLTPSPVNRVMPVNDFYLDFATANFGAEIGAEAGLLLASLEDPKNASTPYGEVMKVSDWGPGPGALHHPIPPFAKKQVASFSALRSKVRGAGNLARFNYWDCTLKATVAMGESTEARKAMESAIKRANDEKDPRKHALMIQAAIEKRIAFARSWDKIMSLQIAACETPGELGTIANLEQHSRGTAQWINAFDQELVKLSGKALPAAAALSTVYTGPAKLTLLTTRSSSAKNEILSLTILALDQNPVKSVLVKSRPLGGGEWKVASAIHRTRAIYQATLPRAMDDFEYHIEAVTHDGKHMLWPASAPIMNQTIVVEELPVNRQGGFFYEK